ncbi:MAG TPA: hypothetical protein PLH57_04865 [Oligoflexia bacterium]|nr:hypothetical protein [Oligoflexia bacterium]
MQKSGISWLKILLVAVLPLFAGACGPSGPSAATDKNQATRFEAALSAIAGATANGIDETLWRCPSYDNVTLKGGYAEQDTTGARNYLVCVARNDSSRLLVVPNSSRSICVYPAVKTGTSWSLLENERCAAVYNDVPQIFDFNSPNINDVVIVDQSVNYAFKQCLTGTVSCPAYSQGTP